MLFATVIAGAATLAHAEPTHVDARDTDRLALGLAGVMYASYPMSIEDPGPALVATKPLWLGKRHRYVQWVLDGAALVGAGTQSKHAHLAIGPQVGTNLYLGGTFGLEFRVGVAGIFQVGSRTVAGLGLSGAGGYVFRFWDDDRRRLKVEIVMNAGGFIADDAGNDLGANASSFGVGLVYETPL
jgi:hypothetical protein